ncbi:hypothetical protein THAOC_20108, partial [Thalassiosira oceanica]
MSSPQHAPTGSATSPDISLAILTQHPPHVNISSRSLDSTPQKPSPSCSTTHSSTSSAPRPASRPPIGPRRVQALPQLHTHFHRYSHRKEVGGDHLPLGAVGQGPILDSHAATPLSIGPTTPINEVARDIDFTPTVGVKNDRRLVSSKYMDGLLAVSVVHGTTMKFGIIKPPPEIRAVVDRTALFVSKNGRAFELKILNSDKGKTTKFAFLDP